ncbi:hypothetical protein GH733_009571 [Mirounga leonina]|nr:hypothetical protein GH733_009571 [Mirounga leonina]
MTAMKMLLHLSLLALGTAYVSVTAVESTMNRLVAETLTLLSAHRTLLIGDGNLMIPTPEHKNKRCGGERWRVEKFLDHLQVFLGVINTEWTTES